jgi:glycine hydroxymethyltransferase
VALAQAATDEFRDYQAKIVLNAKTLAEALLEEGFNLISGGTDNHLVLMDLTDLQITGAQAQDVLERAGITVNKNSIPFDPLPPGKASGIRIGTPAVTTRGMGPDEMRLIASFVWKVLSAPRDDTAIAKVKDQVKEMCDQFPLYVHSDNGD